MIFSTREGQTGQDSVKLMCTDGSQVQTLLAPTPTRSFLYAEGNSLSGSVLTLGEDILSTQTLLHLFLYSPKDGQLTRLTHQDGTEGFGALSPDGGQAVYEFTRSGGNETELWLKNLSTDQTLQLTTQTQQYTDDEFPIWRPDGQEVWFIRAVVFPTLSLTLMRENVSGGPPVVVFGPDQAIGGVAFSPKGDHFALRSFRGIETLDSGTLQRSVIVPLSALPSNSFWVGSLFWSRHGDLLAWLEPVPQSNQWNIWTVRTDGTDLKIIHSETAAEMYLGGFIDP